MQLESSQKLFVVPCHFRANFHPDTEIDTAIRATEYTTETGIVSRLIIAGTSSGLTGYTVTAQDLDTSGFVSIKNTDESFGQKIVSSLNRNHASCSLSCDCAGE